ncbi:hypothetical protein VCHENC02_5932A, partial [Vibrio harveyi]
MTVHCNY